MKSVHFHMLCQTRDDYFEAWERGEGPGQRIGGEGRTFQPVSQDELNVRMAICGECKYYCDERCTQIELGCRNSFRMRIASVKATCPVGKWS